MNAPLIACPSIAPMTPLKAWRKRQMVDDAEKACRRTMRLTDVPLIYGIPFQTWHGWEQPLTSPAFRLPDRTNMARLAEIIGEEFSPEWFYPVAEWRSAPTDRKTEAASGG